MDKVILKFLKSEIKYFFKDFKSEDLNTNLFKGNVELNNLQLNTDVLQDALSAVVPYIQVESATVEKFRLKVPFSSIKTKPTEVWISKIDIKCKEPLNFVEFQNTIKKNEEKKQKELVKTGKYDYTLVDRILDGLQVTIDHIHLSLGLLGKFKHAKSGPWTPHYLDINIYDVQVYSVDEKWKKVPIQETRAYTHGKPHVWHFKETICKVSVRLVPPRDAGGATIAMEAVSLLDRLPVKFRLTQQRLNINETTGSEMSLLLGEVKFSFTSSQLGQLIYWIDALSSAAFRMDIPKSEKPIIPVLERPNTLFSVVIDKLSVQLREIDQTNNQNILFEVFDLQLNRVLQANKMNETITRILLSQVALRNLKLNTLMMQLYFCNPVENTGKHLTLPIPDEVRLHPDRLPEPSVIRYCQLVVVRFPEPDPPTSAFEYTVRTEGFELLMERDGMESLAIFLLQASIINANRIQPTESDYKDKDTSKVDIPLDQGDEEMTIKKDDIEFFELDLLANASALISLNCEINEFIIKVPTPGGADSKPYLELRFDGVSLLGSPSTAPAVYKKDFLDLKSNNGSTLVMPLDFYYQKFNDKGTALTEYTFKFNVAIKCLSINVYEKEGAPKEPVCSILNIASFCKIYSRARHIPDKKTIPQVEALAVAGEVNVRLVQKHHHLVVDFFSEHFLYGSSSVLKKMLEKEIKSLAVEERKFARAQEDPRKKKKFLIFPSYMISAAVDKLSVALIDDNQRDVLNLSALATESIIEKHDDRQIIVARVGDLRVKSLLSELEESIVWVKKTHLQNVAQLRIELRKLNEGYLHANDIGKSKSYILGDLEGVRANFDFRNIYNIQDYLVDVLGETIILIDRTQHSHFWWKILRYIDILYVAGIPSEANNYWRNLREIKLLLEQFSELFDDVSWDLSVSDVRFWFGDEKLKVELFSMDKFKIVREQTEEEDKVICKVEKVKGSLWSTRGDSVGPVEHVLCVPIDTTCQLVRKRKLSENKTPEWDQEVHFESTPNPKILVTSEQFQLLGDLLDRHLPKLVKFFDDLMIHADKGEQRRGTRSSVIFDEDVLDEARGMAARAYSLDTVKAMKKELERSKKELEDALLTQTDIAVKYSEVQMGYHDLLKQYNDLKKEKEEVEKAMVEMQGKMMEVQMKLANAKF